jgi:SAM-dependent methyltransferase
MSSRVPSCGPSAWPNGWPGGCAAVLGTAVTLPPVVETQEQIDSRNAAFWDELCGTTLAQELGITEASPEGLARFDEAYLGFYPYLAGYLPGQGGSRSRLLEIGLGYGTVSQLLAERGFDYHGLDIAPGPVEMVRHRLHMLGIGDPEVRVQAGSVLEMAHPDESFDHVVTIGCLHHTGDIPRAVAEVERVLRPGGRAVVMLYNRRSYRQLKLMVRNLPSRLRGRRMDEEAIRASYDANQEGQAAPATDYTSVGEAKRLFKGFSRVEVHKENFDPADLRDGRYSRESLLGWPARLAGLDLYITALK